MPATKVSMLVAGVLLLCTIGYGCMVQKEVRRIEKYTDDVKAFDEAQRAYEEEWKKFLTGPGNQKALQLKDRDRERARERARAFWRTFWNWTAAPDDPPPPPPLPDTTVSSSLLLIVSLFFFYVVVIDGVATLTKANTPAFFPLVFLLLSGTATLYHYPRPVEALTLYAAAVAGFLLFSAIPFASNASSDKASDMLGDFMRRLFRSRPRVQNNTPPPGVLFGNLKQHGVKK